MGNKYLKQFSRGPKNWRDKEKVKYFCVIWNFYKVHMLFLIRKNI